MTIAAMHDLADLLIDKADAPWFNATEKDRFINLASMEMAKNRYSEFEFNEKRRKDLLSLVRVEEIASSANVNLEIIPDFLFVLSLAADFNDTSCNRVLSQISVRPMQLDDYRRAQHDPFNQPTDDEPFYIERNTGGSRQLEVKSTTTPTRLYLDYLKRPAEVSLSGNIDSDFPEHMHEEIVNLAVRKMFATLSDGEHYQLQLNEIQSQE